tara:strand:- start:739 stop:1395 length:657 start_codon:yes stop_codon:yes gene_type:complete
LGVKDTQIKSIVQIPKNTAFLLFAKTSIMESIVPAIAFYNLTAAAWDQLAEVDRQRMLGTVAFFQEVAVDRDCRTKIQSQALWQDRLAFMEAYIYNQALNEVRASRGEELHVTWERVRDFVRKLQENQPNNKHVHDKLAPKETHPLFVAMVEFTQRAMYMLNDKDWRQEMTLDERDALVLAVQYAVTTSMFFQVPHSVRVLMKALQPFLMLAQAQDLL